LDPPDVREIELISLPELHEIRRLWLYEKRHFDDAVPTIYEETTGEAVSECHLRTTTFLRREDWTILQESMRR
jgi:DNA sulfur modification protein DndC